VRAEVTRWGTTIWGIPRLFTEVKGKGIPVWGIPNRAIPQPFAELKGKILANEPELLRYAQNFITFF
jgi:hypothetical protein